MKAIYKLVCLLAIVMLASCGSSDGSSSSDKFKNLSDYLGEWEKNFASGDEAEAKILEITDDKDFLMGVRVYESSAHENLVYEEEIWATLTGIQTNEKNDDYDSLLIDIDKIIYTPKTESQASTWNSNEFGGETDWQVDVSKTFDEDNIGEGEDSTIWQESVLIAAKFEGELLILRFRAEFDGDDPPEEVYFKD